MPTVDTAPDGTGTDYCATASDRDLIQRFARNRDEEAFAALVSRHARLVMGVCRRNLRNQHDAEDAFQATFMVLARKAGQVRWRNSVASWLYSAAVCVAVNARRRNARRSEVELTMDQPTDSDALEAIAQREERQRLDEELTQLSDRYRLPLLLFHLEGKTRQEVADILGLKLGTVKSRLERGRNQLRMRLALRAVALTSAAIAIRSSQAEAASVLNEFLVSSTVKASIAAAKPSLVGGLPSTNATHLSEVGIKAMSKTVFTTKSLTLGSAVVCAMLLLAAPSGDSGSSLASHGNGSPLPVTTTISTSDDSNAATEAPVVVTVAQTSEAANQETKKSPRSPFGVDDPFEDVPAEDTPKQPPPVKGGISEIMRGRNALEAKMLAELDRPVRNFEFPETALQDFTEALADIHEFQVLIDQRKESFIDPTIPVNLIVDDVSLHTALLLALRPLDLTYVITDEIMLVTTPASANEMVQVRVYSIPDWITKDPKGTDLLLSLGADFDGALGPASASKPEATRLEMLGDRLIVRGTYQQQRAVAELLRSLRE